MAHRRGRAIGPVLYEFASFLAALDCQKRLPHPMVGGRLTEYGIFRVSDGVLVAYTGDNIAEKAGNIRGKLHGVSAGQPRRRNSLEFSRRHWAVRRKAS